MPGSPWEKVSAAQIKKWKIDTKKAMALPLGRTTASVVRIKVYKTPFGLPIYINLHLLSIQYMEVIKHRGAGLHPCSRVHI